MLIGESLNNALMRKDKAKVSQVRIDNNLIKKNNRGLDAVQMRKKWVLVGSIGKPYGLKGWVKVNSYTEPFSNILHYRPWYLLAPGKGHPPSPIEISGDHLHGQHLVVQLANCKTPESACLFTNHKIYVEREKFFPLAEREYYWIDLEGLKVYTCEKVYLGTVQAIFATGANDVLLVVDQKRHLIPFLLDKTIKSIDIEHQTMLVDWDPDF
jgi:16S rRNA processing protein RimM